MKNLTLIFILAIILSGCATTRQAKTNQQRQNYMILDNTEMRINKKYQSKSVNKLKKKTARKYRKGKY